MSAKTSATLTSGLEPAPGHGLPKRLGARCYDSIGEAAQSLDFSGGEAPGIDALNDLMRRRAKSIVTAGGHSVRFSEQNMDPSALGYESQIFETGSVSTRPNSMHDLFNALVWLTFPLTKAAINHRHIAARASPTPGGNRGAAQDLLTLFDECGVFVVSDRPANCNCDRWRWIPRVPGRGACDGQALSQCAAGAQPARTSWPA